MQQKLKKCVASYNKYKQDISTKRSEISTKNTLAVKSCGQELKNGHVEKDMKSKNGQPMAAQ